MFIIKNLNKNIDKNLLTTIEEINNFYKLAAEEAREYYRKNPEMAGNWDVYYESLIDFHLKDEFSISSADFDCPVRKYIEDNNLNYTIMGFTGYCIYKKNT